MGNRLTASFDELIRNRYGAAPGDDPRFALRIEDLFAGYYGRSGASMPQRGRKATSVVLSCPADDGETLPQRRVPVRNGQARARKGEYVAQQSCGCADTAGGGPSEYVARRAAPPARSSAAVRQQSLPADDMAMQECRVDLMEPTRDAAPARRSTPPQAAPRVLHPEVLPAAGHSTEASATEKDFLADMQSILLGQKVFDPATKKTVDKGALAPAQPERPSPEARNEQAIFDRIAQSMQFANAYDLGSIDLENRFADFDAMSDRKDRATAPRRPANGKAAAAPSGSRQTAPEQVGNEDFLHDLDDIKTPPMAAAQSTTGQYSEPLFDTGEHAQFAGDQYQDRFRVGSGQGVMFSYGQIITMADLFEKVDDMMAADPAELQRLKSLIERDTTHYTTGSGSGAGTSDWQSATRNRYLRLAEDNYEHFSPNAVFKSTALGRARQRQGDNKSAWERYHRRAIEEAQRVYLASPGNASIFYEWPLTINAFGDHFLTDAFASGHVINKEFMMALFKSKFLSGSSLTAKGKAFFEKVASKAWHGDVARRFSGLETVDYPVCALGWCLKWHPNIDSADRFSKVLIGAAEQQPDRIANFAVKALHDYLNRTGLEVTNGAGDGTWTIKGDGYLDALNLPIVQRAVQQSIDNINDPGILASNIDFAGFFQKVWKHVPRPTAASLATLERLTSDYTSPDSETLADSAAVIINRELDALIQTLLEEHKLQAA